jgi:hypothetical protein
VLSPGSNFNNIEKELLKKNCIELYELVLKLKTDSELAEEKTEIKPIFSNLFNENKVEPKINQPEEKKIEAPIFEKQIIEIPEPEIVQTIVTFEAPQSFNEVIKKVDVEEETLNSLQEKASSSIQDYDDLSESELKFNTEEYQIYEEFYRSLQDQKALDNDPNNPNYQSLSKDLINYRNSLSMRMKELNKMHEEIFDALEQKIKDLTGDNKRKKKYFIMIIVLIAATATSSRLDPPIQYTFPNHNT